MQWYEVRHGDCKFGDRCFSRREAVAEAERMTRIYRFPMRVVRVETQETEVYKTKGARRCA